LVIAQFRWPNWAGTVPSSPERSYSRKPLGGRTEPSLSLFSITYRNGTAASKNTWGRFVESIAAEARLFHSCLGKMYRCGSDDSFALFDGDELVRL
jgi:hypothetical protein